VEGRSAFYAPSCARWRISIRHAYPGPTYSQSAIFVTRPTLLDSYGLHSARIERLADCVFGRSAIGTALALLLSRLHKRHSR